MRLAPGSPIQTPDAVGRLSLLFGLVPGLMLIGSLVLILPYNLADSQRAVQQEAQQMFNSVLQARYYKEFYRKMTFTKFDTTNYTPVNAIRLLGLDRMRRMRKASSAGWEALISPHFITRVIQTLFQVGFIDAAEGPWHRRRFELCRKKSIERPIAGRPLRRSL